jgi:hypothetical protein
LKRALQRRNKSEVQTSGSMAVEAIVRVFAANLLFYLSKVKSTEESEVFSGGL